MFRQAWSIYAAIAIICALLGFLVYAKCREDFDASYEHYRQLSDDKTLLAVERMENILTPIYQNLRTISFLPGVRRIGRHAANMSKDDKMALQQIYNNLASAVAISEVYIVPVDIDPGKTDPVTKEPEAPIIMFDELIVNSGSSRKDFSDSMSQGQAFDRMQPEKEAAEKGSLLPEEEIHEYRAFHALMARLKTEYPDIKRVRGLDLPVFGTPEVITCDNSVYAQTRNDEDRKGIIFSVPFFGEDGKLKGVVAAIIRSNVLRDVLPGAGFALVNSAYDYTLLPRKPGQEIPSLKWVAMGQTDPTLLYSTVSVVHLNDPWGKWVLWVGHPNDAFLQSEAVRALRSFEFSWYMFIVAFGVMSAVLWMFILRWVDLTRENFENSLRAVENASRARFEFLARMSRDMGEPIHQVAQASALLTQDRTLNPESVKSVKAIRNASLQLSNTVRNIFDLSQFGFLGPVPKEEPFSFRTVVYNVVNALKPLAQAKDITLHITLLQEDSLPDLLGDEMRVASILHNLVSNAIKFTEKGLVRIEARHELKEEGGCTLYVEVIDNGKGIPERLHNALFPKSLPVAGEPLAALPTTGAGLVIVKELVASMKGQVGVNSAEELGSIFWFSLTFPLADAGSKAAA